MITYSLQVANMISHIVKAHILHEMKLFHRPRPRSRNEILLKTAMAENLRRDYAFIRRNKSTVMGTRLFFL